MDQVHFAFRQEHGVFVAGHDTHRVEADADGTVRFFPIADRDQGPDAPLRLRVSSLARGARSLEVTPSAISRGATTDVLELRRAGFTELIDNGPAGVEQRFRFDTPPRGEGALTLELETDARWLGQTKTGHHFAAGSRSVAYGPATWVAADGTRVALRTTRTHKGLRITVPADVAARGPWPAVIDPLVSAELAVDSPVLVAPASQQDTPAVAFDGTNFLVVWRDFRGGGGSDLYATRVDATGAVLDPGGLTIAGGAGGQFQPAVTFGAGQYYVSFSDTRAGGSDIYGTRVSTAGVPLDGSGVSLTNATGLQVNSDVVFNGTDYLVVWEDLRRGGTDSPDVYATRVTTAGVVLDPTPNLAVSAAVWGQYLPRLDVDPSTGTSFVTWEDTRNLESDIYGAMVDVGGLVGAAVPVNRATQTQDRADVAFNGTHFIVVWTDRRAAGSVADIYAARVTTAGGVLDMQGVVISSAAGDQDWPAIAGTTTQFAVWRDARNGANTDVYGTVVLPNANPASTLGVLVSGAAQTQAEPKLALGGAQFFAAWTDSRDGNADLFGTSISLGGVVASTLGTPLNLAANQQGQVALASDGTKFLAVWQDFRGGGTADLYGVLVDATGALVGSPFIISSAAGSEASPSAVWNGTHYVVAWTDLRAGGAGDVYAARVSGDGALLDPAGIAISAGPGAKTTPSVASFGVGALIAWQDSRSGNADIYVARLTPAGIVLDPTGVPVSTATGDQTGVKAVAFNGGYLLAWTDGRAGNTDIYAARLDSMGAVQDVTGIGVSLGTAPADSVSLSASATQALVVWRDSRAASNADIFGARITTGGVVVDGSGLAIGNAVGAQSLPAVAWDSASLTWAVYWEDFSTSLEGEVFGADVTGGAIVSVPALVGPGRNPAVVYSSSSAGLLGYTRFVSGAGVNHFRARLRLSGRRAVGAACGAPSECLSMSCVLGLCTSAAVDAGVDGGADAGLADAGNDAGAPDAGADAGEPDAGADAGDPDAGAHDAGASDAGSADAGAPDAGLQDAGVPDAGGPDAGEVDAGMLDAGASAVRFAGQPPTTASCNEPWHWEPVTTGDGPITWSLRVAPQGMTVGDDGSLDWEPKVGGTTPVVLVATGPGNEVESSFELEVSCPRRTLGVSCGCDGTQAAVWLLAVLLFRRRVRPHLRSR